MEAVHIYPACVAMWHKSGVTASRTAGKGTMRACLGVGLRVVVVVGCYCVISNILQ